MEKDNQNKIILKRRLQGIIVSDKMTKTVVVMVEYTKKHPKYRKYYKISKKFKAHDEREEYGMGDVVLIEQTRPLSRDKRWKVVKLINKGFVENDSLVE